MIYAEFCNPDIEANNYVFKTVTFDLNKFDDQEPVDYESHHFDLIVKLRANEEERHVQINQEIKEQDQQKFETKIEPKVE